jgi:hypothetical protein
MALKITLPIVEGMYQLLKASPPFNRWKLPDHEDIGFALNRTQGNRGEFYVKDGIPYLGINDTSHETLDELMRTVAHEMCHLREFLTGQRADVHHGAYFKRSAASVCKAHQFDKGAF